VLAGAVKEFTELRPAIAAIVAAFELTNPLPSSLETEQKKSWKHSDVKHRQP